jgi:hypothetical protein
MRWSGLGRIAPAIQRSDRYQRYLATIGSSAKIIINRDLLRDFESFHGKLESFENGPVDLQMFGNVAEALISDARMRNVS